jgi:Antibiotic biosynthesis monooxygenase
MSFTPDAHLISITLFTPKPEHFDTFVDIQLESLPRLGSMSRSRGAQFYVAKDGRRAILVSFFENETVLRDFEQSEDFRAHRDRLQTLIESAESGFYTLAYERAAEPA